MAVSTIADDKKKALNLAIAQIEKSCGKGSIMRMDAKEKVRVEAEAERGKIQSASASADERVRAEGKAAAQKLIGEADAEVERLKAEAWKHASPAVVLGVALGRFLGQIQNIETLNITPDMLGESLRRVLTEKKAD